MGNCRGGRLESSSVVISSQGISTRCRAPAGSGVVF